MTKFYQMLLESRYTGSKTPIFQLNPSSKDLKTLRFAKDPDGRVHSCITIDGKDYRCRSEMLVIKDDTVFALKLEDGKLKDGRPYVLPGGSLEEGLTVEEKKVLRKECIKNAGKYDTNSVIKTLSKYLNDSI